MIPKIIHYCWFGYGRLPRMARKCIRSWKKQMPEYQIKVWNEENFDIHCCKYVEEAYMARKFAFVSDYARLFALNMEGGVYFDTDVEAIRTLNEYLRFPAFVGFEYHQKVGTGVFGSEPQGRLVREWLEDYAGRKFVRSNGEFDMTPNVDVLTRLLRNHGASLHGEVEIIDDYAVVYPVDFFCAKSWDTGKYNITKNTHAVHHYAGSWFSRRTRVLRWIDRHMGSTVALYVRFFWRPLPVVAKGVLVAVKKRLSM